jgi:protein-S-isoprenylcysteine O-methyltransferase Ste14
LIGLLVGALSFVMVYLSDLLSVRKITGAKQIFLLFFVILQGYALYLACSDVERFSLPAALPWIGWFLLVISVPLLIYSLFIEIPFNKAYIKSGISHQLVTTGTYALARHPWVLWYTLFLISLVLITRSKILALATPVWVFMDVLAALIQENFVLMRVFPDYEQYRHETPMLIPTKRSIASFVGNFKNRRR